MAAAANWYPDPMQRHELRYWDGNAWTEHVSDRGVVGVDPLVAAEPSVAVGQPGSGATVPDASSTSSRPFEIDTVLHRGLRSKRLVIDEHALRWGDEHVPFSEVTAVTWWWSWPAGSGVGYREYNLALRREKRTEIGFAGPAARQDGIYTQVVDAVQHHVGVRLILEFVDRLTAGETVVVGGWELSPAGIRVKKGSAGWGERLQYTSHPRGSGLVVEVVADGAKDRRLGAVDDRVDNGALVPYLLRFGADHFARRG